MSAPPPNPIVTIAVMGKAPPGPTQAIEAGHHQNEEAHHPATTRPPRRTQPLAPQPAHRPPPRPWKRR
jgi:hypothetical protein